MSSKYFIAIIPTSPLQENLSTIKNDIATKYSCVGALNSPAHITLHMPFELEGKKEKIFLLAFNKLSLKIEPFKVLLNGFNCFAPRVVFVSVGPSEKLNALQLNTVDFMKKKINIFNQSDAIRGFHPHITVAFRGLNKTKFYNIWEEYAQKTFDETFYCNRITLLRLTKEKKWEPCLESNLN